MVALTPYGPGTTATSATPAALTSAAGQRYVNPASHDYEYNSTDGQLAQMPSIRQRVMLAVQQMRGSMSCTPGTGILVPRKMGDTFVTEMQQATRAALAQLTDVEKVIRIDGITVVHGANGRASVTLSYSGREDGAEMGASGGVLQTGSFDYTFDFTFG